jgi:hypothetical protein
MSSQEWVLLVVFGLVLVAFGMLLAHAFRNLLKQVIQFSTFRQVKCPHCGCPLS